MGRKYIHRVWGFRRAVAVDSFLLWHVAGLLRTVFGTFLTICCWTVPEAWVTCSRHLNVRIRLLSNSALYPRKKGILKARRCTGRLSILLWGSANSHATVKRVTGIIYHHVMQVYLKPHLLKGKPSNLDGASPDINHDVTTFLNWQFPERWFGRSGKLLASLISRSDLLRTFPVGLREICLRCASAYNTEQIEGSNTSSNCKNWTAFTVECLARSQILFSSAQDDKWSTHLTCKEHGKKFFTCTLLRCTFNFVWLFLSYQ